MTSTVANTGLAVSFVDLLLIGTTFIYFNNRLNKLEGDSTISSGGTSENKLSKSTVTNVLENRVLSLENDIEILLQRLHCYDELIGKMMHRIKETDDAVNVSHKITGHSINLSPRKTSIRFRKTNPILSRKDPFIDDEDTSMENYSSDSDDDEDFSFLKD